MAWVRRFGLATDEAEADRLAATNAGELGARVTADALDVEHAQFAVDSLLWLFAFDDAFCDEGLHSHDPGAMVALATDLLRTAETARPRSDLPHMTALADLRRRIDAGLGSPVQASRWVHALHSYLLYQVWEAAHRSARTIPELDQYLIARIYNGAMPVCIASLEISGGYEAPGHQIQTPAVRALGEMCCAMVSYDNDIISHWKESLRSGDGINLIDILARHHELTLDQAQTEAVALRDRVLGQYLRLREQTQSRVTEDTRRYIRGLDAWIRGNIDWGMNSHRYRNPTDPADLPENPDSLDTHHHRSFAHRRGHFLVGRLEPTAGMSRSPGRRPLKLTAIRRTQSTEHIESASATADSHEAECIAPETTGPAWEARALAAVAEQ